MTVKQAVKAFKAARMKVRAAITAMRKSERAACKAKIAKLPHGYADKKLKIRYHYRIDLVYNGWLPRGIERDALTHYRVTKLFKVPDNYYYSDLKSAQAQAKYAQEVRRKKEREILREANKILKRK